MDAEWPRSAFRSTGVGLSEPEDPLTNGATYLYLTPRNGLTGSCRSAFSNAGFRTERLVDTGAPLRTDVLVHLAVVVDGAARTLAFYEDGVSLGRADLVDRSLTRLNDVNNWIGRSQFTSDEGFSGTIFEFRIYGGARTPEQIAADFAAGPDALLPDSPAPDAGTDAAAG
jgi:hypothetical protein